MNSLSRQRRGRLICGGLLSISMSFWRSAPSFAEDGIGQSRMSETRTTNPAIEVKDEIQFLHEETVVTANWEEQPISEAPSNVYVITAEDIRHSGATDVPTLLRRVPGISVIQMTGGQFNVSARGNNQDISNKMLLLIDGRSAYIDAQGVAPWTQLPIVLTEIKRIEVLKGPAAAIYGFNAFDGVINIITKAPEEMKGATVQVAGGEFGTIRSSAVYANRHDRIGYRLSAGHDQNQQWRDREALALRNNRFNGQLDYHLTENDTLRVEGGVVDTNRLDALSQIIRFNTPNEISYGRVGYERPNFFIRAFWSEQANTLTNFTLQPMTPFLTVIDRLGRDAGIPIINDTYDIVSQYSPQLGLSNRLIAGFNYRQNTLSSTQAVGFSREQRLGLYLQDEWRPRDEITLTAGVRADMHSEIHPTLSPRVALLYSPVPHHTFRLSGSVGYRPPTLLETNLSAQTVVNVFGSRNASSTRGSSNLDPEKIVSYEAEYQGWYFNHRVRTRVALFWNEISNLIGSVVTSPQTNTFANSPRVADIRGGEIGVEFLATSWLSGMANYAYQDIRQSMTGQSRRGGPSATVNAGLRADFDNGLNGEAMVHYVGSAVYPVRPEFSTFAGLGLISPSSIPNSTVDSYTLLNLRCGYRFWKEKAEVAISFFNALNDRHREHPLGDVIGSRVMGWLTLSL